MMFGRVKSVVAGILKDPLTHFLVLGLGLFLLNGLVNWGGDQDRVIVVDRPALLAYIQRDAKNFDADWAARTLDGLSDKDRKFLIDRYVWDQALFRSALEQGMERTDDGVHERLVQKMEFIAASSAPVIESVSDAQVRAYYEANKDQYYIEPQVTFTHIFYSYAKYGGVEGAEKKAQAVLAELKAKSVSFEGAKDYGDDYAFQKDYIGVSRDVVMSHFNEEMAETVFDPKTPHGQWLGPFESLNGVHLVMVSKLEAGYIPAMVDVPWVRSDALAALRYDQDQAQVQALVDHYKVKVELK